MVNKVDMFSVLPRRTFWRPAAINGAIWNKNRRPSAISESVSNRKIASAHVYLNATIQVYRRIMLLKPNLPRAFRGIVVRRALGRTGGYVPGGSGRPGEQEVASDETFVGQPKYNSSFQRPDGKTVTLTVLLPADPISETTPTHPF
jgi:hypothetical protein